MDEDGEGNSNVGDLGIKGHGNDISEHEGVDHDIVDPEHQIESTGVNGSSISDHIDNDEMAGSKGDDDGGDGIDDDGVDGIVNDDVDNDIDNDDDDNDADRDDASNMELGKGRPKRHSDGPALLKCTVGNPDEMSMG